MYTVFEKELHLRPFVVSGSLLQRNVENVGKIGTAHLLK